MNRNNHFQVIKKQNIFSKIIIFLKNNFSKKEVSLNEIKENTTISTMKRISFKDELKETVNKKSRLLEIQKAIRMGKVKEEDLSQTDVIELKKLYKEQIAQLKKSTKQYHDKVAMIKTKIAQNSN